MQQSYSDHDAVESIKNVLLHVFDWCVVIWWCIALWQLFSHIRCFWMTLLYFPHSTPLYLHFCCVDAVILLKWTRPVISIRLSCSSTKHQNGNRKVLFWDNGLHLFSIVPETFSPSQQSSQHVPIHRYWPKCTHTLCTLLQEKHTRTQCSWKQGVPPTVNTILCLTLALYIC